MKSLQANIYNLLAVIFSGWSMLLILPIPPKMPSKGIEESYMMALNEALAHNLRFGTEIIFSYGPYASVHTNLYHSKTFLLSLLGGTCVAICFVIPLLIFAYRKDSKNPFVIAMMPFITLILIYPTKDGLFILLPFFTLLCFLNIFNENDGKIKVPDSLKWLLYCILMFNLSLISLIKGSFAISCVMFLILICLHTLSEKRIWKALFLIGSYGGFLVLLWRLAGQDVSDLPAFFINLKEIVSGYTDAMSINGPVIEIIAFIIFSFFALGIVWFSPTCTKKRFFILTGLGMTLFLGLKAGFVRHDGHALISFSVLFGTAYLLYLLRRNSASLVFIFIAMALYTGVMWHYKLFQPLEPVKAYTLRALEPASAAAKLVKHYGSLQDENSKALEDIRKKGCLPYVEGSADFLSFEQYLLIASGIKYRPRPVFQSYKVYTPTLINKNAAFFSGPNACDHVFFSIEPIDRRLPSLEDGRVWLELINRYELVSGKHLIALFQRRKIPFIENPDEFMKHIGDDTLTLGEKKDLPQTQGALWIELDVQSTWFGHIGNTLYKLPQLKIIITTINGTEHTYRYIAGMGKGGFLVSPLIKNIIDFIALINGKKTLEKVQSIQIKQSSDWPVLWRNQMIKARFFEVSIPIHPKLTDHLIPIQEKGKMQALN